MFDHIRDDFYPWTDRRQSSTSSPPLDSPSPTSSASPYIMDPESSAYAISTEPRPKLSLDTYAAAYSAMGTGTCMQGPSYTADGTSICMFSSSPASSLSTDPHVSSASSHAALYPSHHSAVFLQTRPVSAGPSPSSMHVAWPIMLPPLGYHHQAYGVARSPTHAYSRRAAAAPYSAQASHHRRSLPFLYSSPTAAPNRTLSLAQRHHPVSIPATQPQVYVSSPSASSTHLYYRGAPQPSHILPVSTSAPPVHVPPQPLSAYSASHLPYPIEPKPLVLHQPRPVRPIPPIEIPDPDTGLERELAPAPAPEAVEDDEFDDDEADEDWDVDEDEMGPTISPEIPRPGSIPLLCQPLPGYRR